MANREHIEAYFVACSEGSAEDIASHFTPDAVVYDTNQKPVRQGATIGEFWTKIRKRWQGARWYVDTCITQGDAAAIEWTMTGSTQSGPFMVRGSEHYRFEGGKIAEIRQYWTFDKDRLSTGLVAFPYETCASYHGD